MVPPQASPTFQAALSSNSELEDLGRSCGQNLGGLGDHRPLDAAARNRAEKIPALVDGELAAHGLRRRTPGLNDGGKRDATPLFKPIEGPGNDVEIGRAHRFIMEFQALTAELSGASDTLHIAIC